MLDAEHMCSAGFERIHGRPDPLVRPRGVVPELAPAIEDAILKGLEIDYHARPKDAGEFQELQEQASQTFRRKTARFTSEPAPAPSGSDRPRTVSKALVAIGVVVIALTAGVLLFRSGILGGTDDTTAATTGGKATGGTLIEASRERGSPAAAKSSTSLVVRMVYADGNGLDAVNVSLNPGNIAARAGQRGEYILDGLSPQTYQVAANWPGYRGEARAVTVTPKMGAVSREMLVLRRSEVRSPHSGTAASAKVDSAPAPPPPAAQSPSEQAKPSQPPQRESPPADALYYGSPSSAGTSGSPSGGRSQAGITNTGLNYRILQRLENGREFDVSPDVTFHSGDRVRFVFQSNMDGYLYVIQQGSSGRWSVLFPSPDINGGRNSIRRFEDYAVPSTEGWFTFNDEPGVENVLVFLSMTPMDKLLGLDVRVTRPEVQDEAVTRAFNSLSLKSRDLVSEQKSGKGQSPSAESPKGTYVVNRTPNADAVTVSIRLTHR